MAGNVNLADEEIIKRKLLIDGDGVGDDRRLNQLLKSFIKWSSSKEDNEEESSLNFERILLLLYSCENAMAKSQQMYLANELEMDNYGKLQKNIQDNIEEAQERISRFKSDLQAAKIVRKNKQEYDALAKIIEGCPNRSETIQRLTRMEEEIKKLEEARQEINRKLEKRRRQFQVLLSAANELKLILEDEDDLLESMEPQSSQSLQVVGESSALMPSKKDESMDVGS